MDIDKIQEPIVIDFVSAKKKYVDHAEPEQTSATQNQQNEPQVIDFLLEKYSMGAYTEADFEAYLDDESKYYELLDEYKILHRAQRKLVRKLYSTEKLKRSNHKTAVRLAIGNAVGSGVVGAFLWAGITTLKATAWLGGLMLGAGALCIAGITGIGVLAGQCFKYCKICKDEIKELHETIDQVTIKTNETRAELNYYANKLGEPEI